MKKLLFIMVVGFGGAMLIKGGHVTVTPDNQVRVVGYSVPLPAAVQNSPVFGIVVAGLIGQSSGNSQAAAAPSRPGAPKPPAVPAVTSTAGTDNANSPRAAQGAQSDQFNAAARAIRGQ